MEAMIENFVPLIKPSKGFEELKRLVIDQGICSGCSTCAAFCERIEMSKDGPVLKKDCNMKIGAITCNENGTCYDSCPMISFSNSELEKEIFRDTRNDEDLGYYKKILAVRSKIPEILEKAQDGGAVTSLLLCALENKLIDGAVVATRFNNWDTSPIIAKSKEELLQAAGTKYTRTATSMKLGRSLQELSRLALVGTGCQITGARKTQISFLKNLLKITSESENPLDFLLIGLFCFENFPYDGLRRTIESKFNIQMDQIIKTDIKKGKFIVYTKNGQVEKSVKAFEECVPESCKLCCNFTAEFSDISVGSVGTPAGWSTVIVRTQKGINLLTKAEELGYVEVEKRVELNEIKKNVSLKKEKRKVVSELRGKEGKYVPYYT